MSIHTVQIKSYGQWMSFRVSTEYVPADYVCGVRCPAHYEIQGIYHSSNPAKNIYDELTVDEVERIESIMGEVCLR